MKKKKLFNRRERKILSDVIIKRGELQQIAKAAEELSELSALLSKLVARSIAGRRTFASISLFTRDRLPELNRILEELGDVDIVLHQLRAIFGPTDRAYYSRRLLELEEKISRDESSGGVRIDFGLKEAEIVRKPEHTVAPKGEELERQAVKLRVRDLKKGMKLLTAGVFDAAFREIVDIIEPHDFPSMRLIKVAAPGGGSFPVERMATDIEYVSRTSFLEATMKPFADMFREIGKTAETFKAATQVLFVRDLKPGMRIVLGLDPVTKQLDTLELLEIEDKEPKPGFQPSRLLVLPGGRRMRYLGHDTLTVEKASIPATEEVITERRFVEIVPAPLPEDHPMVNITRRTAPRFVEKGHEILINCRVPGLAQGQGFLMVEKTERNGPEIQIDLTTPSGTKLWTKVALGQPILRKEIPLNINPDEIRRQQELERERKDIPALKGAVEVEPIPLASCSMTNSLVRYIAAHFLREGHQVLLKAGTFGGGTVFGMVRQIVRDADGTFLRVFFSGATRRPADAPEPWTALSAREIVAVKMEGPTLPDDGQAGQIGVARFPLETCGGDAKEIVSELITGADLKDTDSLLVSDDLSFRKIGKIVAEEPTPENGPEPTRRIIYAAGGWSRIRKDQRVAILPRKNPNDSRTVTRIYPAVGGPDVFRTDGILTQHKYARNLQIGDAILMADKTFRTISDHYWSPIRSKPSTLHVIYEGGEMTDIHADTLVLVYPRD